MPEPVEKEDLDKKETVLKKENNFFKKVLQFGEECDIIMDVAEKTAHRGIAQLVEYRSPKPWVAGSNPPAPAKKKAIRKSEWLFSVKSAVGGRNPPSVDEIASR